MAVRRCNGEGTFITMPNGKIRLRRQYGYNENGNVRFLTVTGKSRKECIRLMEERITELDKKAGVFRGGDTVEELCRKHLNTHISQRGRIKATAADRRESTINNQVAPYPIAHMQASAVRPIDIEGHIETLIAEDRLSVSSIEKAFHVLNGAYRWAVARQELSYNPCEAVREGIMNRLNRLAEKDADSNDVIILSEHEVECLRRTALVRRENGTYKYPVGPYVLFLLETGMRVGELCALKWGNIQWDEDATVVSILGTRHHIKVREGDDAGYRVCDGSVKNMHSRHIVLNSEAAEILEGIYNESKDTSPQGYVFVNRRLKPTNPSNVGVLINKFYRAAGLGEGVSGAQVLRRTFATGEFLKGADVKSIASYIGDLETTTSQYYISVKNNVRIGGKIMNVAPLPHLVKASGQNG